MEEIIWVVLKISGILKNHRSTKLEFQGFFSHMYIRYHIVDVLIPFVTKGKNWVTESLDEVLEISWSMLESGKKKPTQFYEFLIFSRQVENMSAFLSGLQSGEM